MTHSVTTHQQGPVYIVTLDRADVRNAVDLILTGRKVEAAEALQMGLCNRVVPTGEALASAIALAEQLAAFPQQTMLADRASAYAQWDLDLPLALLR